MAHDMQTASGQTGSGFTRAGEIWGRRKWLGIAVFAAVLAVSLGIVAALPPMFRSRATVLVDREQVPEAFVRSAVSGEVETRIQRISQEVLSRERLAGLIERFNLYPKLAAPLDQRVGDRGDASRHRSSSRRWWTRAAVASPRSASA